MTNPKYKFFRSELADHEILKYSNGREIEPRWSTKELKEGAERVIAELEKRGYKRMRFASNTSISFSKPEFCNSAYVGTFVNSFSYNEKYFHWSDAFATAHKSIELHEVNRGNGTVANASLSISVVCFPGPTEVTYYTNNEREGGKINKYGVERPKTTDWCSMNGRSGTNTRIRKFRPTVSDNVLNKILNEAEALIDTLEINDMSKFEKDHKDFPLENDKEYWEYRKAKDSLS